MIGFNKPYVTGRETKYIEDAICREKLSGNGYYTQRCQDFLKHRYKLKKVLLTSSCTDALEIAAMLISVGPGDEIIMPSFTFVSTANAFVLRGARVVFAESAPANPNLDVDKIEQLITPRTKAIVVVHYAGISCEMDKVMTLADRYNLFVIEDAAQAIESTYKNRPLGSIGHLGCFSFHETKNIISGEGGAILINDPEFVERAEVIWEKGTNRSAFSRGEVSRYSWIDIGSSFLPSEITAAFLFAQLESIDMIQQKRTVLWDEYLIRLRELHEFFTMPSIPEDCHHNAHIFYLVCKPGLQRDTLLSYLNKNGVNAISHYLSLHKSPFFSSRNEVPNLPFCDQYADNIVRLPLYYEMSIADVEFVTEKIKAFVSFRRT